MHFMNGRLLLFSLILIFSPLIMAGPSYSAKITQFVISPSTVNLPDQDPDLSPEVSSFTDLTVSFSIRQMNPGEIWLLEINSDGDLASGPDSIPISNVRWTVTGTGSGPSSFQNGTLSRGVYIKVGEGASDPLKKADVTCFLRFYLKNLWTYYSGNYTRIITFRLTVPGDVQSPTFALSLNLIGRAKLEFGMLGISFPDADPDGVPSIAANQNPVQVTCSIRTGSALTATLNCLASGDFISGTSNIPVGNMRWEGTGSGYISGTMNKATRQVVGNWTGSGKFGGALSFFLANSWSYNAGNYSTTISYDLVAP
jgi:hypothetical protein